MSELLEELTELWQKYTDLDDYSLSTQYKSYDDNAYEGDGAYYKSAEGFMWWLVDGAPSIEEMRAKEL